MLFVGLLFSYLLTYISVCNSVSIHVFYLFVCLSISLSIYTPVSPWREPADPKPEDSADQNEAPLRGGAGSGRSPGETH